MVRIGSHTGQSEEVSLDRFDRRFLAMLRQWTCELLPRRGVEDGWHYQVSRTRSLTHDQC